MAQYTPEKGTTLLDPSDEIDKSEIHIYADAAFKFIEMTAADSIAINIDVNEALDNCKANIDSLATKFSATTSGVTLEETLVELKRQLSEAVKVEVAAATTEEALVNDRKLALMEQSIIYIAGKLASMQIAE